MNALIMGCVGVCVAVCIAVCVAVCRNVSITNELCVANSINAVSIKLCYACTVCHTYFVCRQHDRRTDDVLCCSMCCSVRCRMLQCVNHTYNVCRGLDQLTEQQIALTHVICVTHVLCVANWINALIVCCVAVRVAVCVAVACHEIYEIYYTCVVFCPQLATFNVILSDVEVSWTS